MWEIRAGKSIRRSIGGFNVTLDSSDIVLVTNPNLAESCGRMPKSGIFSYTSALSWNGGTKTGWRWVILRSTNRPGDHGMLEPLLYLSGYQSDLWEDILEISLVYQD